MTIHGEPLRLGARPDAAKVLCIFVHGRTQSPEDMVEQVIRHLAIDDVAVVLPRAADNSWYAARATEPLTPGTRAQLAASVDYVHGLVTELRASGGGAKPLVIAGFSQGACLSLEYAMAHGPWHGAMVNLTGCRVGLASDDRAVSDLDGLPVYLTGSDQDAWIPVDAFASAAEALGRARARLRCELFPGRAHEASLDEVAMLGKMLSDLSLGLVPFQPIHLSPG